VIAVVVAAIVTFGIGALWYSPWLFAQQWLAFNGYGPEKAEAMRKDAARAYGISFVCYLVMAAAFAVVVRMTHIEAAVGGAKLGVLLWVGFVAATGLTASVYSGKPFKAFALDAGYQLVYLVVMGVILVAWH
ncbi:MAG TPA: DUF1761 domain-containing protein, partial [Gammaproteobacteria bacterium]